MDICVQCMREVNDCVLQGGLWWCPRCHREYMLAAWRYEAAHSLHRHPYQPPDVGADVPGGGAV